MSDHTLNRSSGDDSLEALTEDRVATWNSFTRATTIAVIFVVVLLILMAIFLI